MIAAITRPNEAFRHEPSAAREIAVPADMGVLEQGQPSFAHRSEL